MLPRNPSSLLHSWSPISSSQSRSNFVFSRLLLLPYDLVDSSECPSLFSLFIPLAHLVRSSMWKLSVRIFIRWRGGTYLRRWRANMHVRLSRKLIPSSSISSNKNWEKGETRSLNAFNPDNARTTKLYLYSNASQRQQQGHQMKIYSVGANIRKIHQCS